MTQPVTVLSGKDHLVLLLTYGNGSKRECWHHDTLPRHPPSSSTLLLTPAPCPLPTSPSCPVLPQPKE